jgi:hypothetical protein
VGMNYRCRHTRVTAPELRPGCRECRCAIHSKAAQVKCRGCGARMHEHCAVPYGDEFFCAGCAAAEMEADGRALSADLMHLSLAEKLVASVAVVEYRKGAAA